MDAHTERPRTAYTRRPRTHQEPLHFLQRVGTWALCALIQDLPARDLLAGNLVWVRRTTGDTYDLLDNDSRSARGCMSARQALWSLSLIRAQGLFVVQYAGAQLGPQLDAQWDSSSQVLS